MFVGQSVIFVKELESTNDYLKLMTKNDALPEGAVVVAEYQYHGRGQQANTWQSEAGENALFSVLLKPKTLKGESLNALSFLVSLAVRATIQHFLPNKEVKVKWPNDVLVENRKVAGILIENKLGKALESIVGIGINVNQTVFKELPMATSLRKEGDKTFEVSEVVSVCLNFVEKYYLLSNRAHGVKQLQTLYVTQLYKLNEEVLIDSKKMKVIGVDMEGKLMLKDEKSTRSVYHKEVNVTWN